MRAAIFACLICMAWAFYELSGGADFVPASEQVVELDPSDDGAIPLNAALTPTAPQPEITRVSLDLEAADRVARGDTAASRPAIVQISREPAAEITAETDASEVPTDEPVIVLPSLVGGAAGTASLAPVRDLRQVSGSRVNMRGGPGTSHGVVTTLSRGTEVEVLEDDGNGWVRLRILDSGTEGWMSASLLSEG